MNKRANMKADRYDSATERSSENRERTGSAANPGESESEENSGGLETPGAASAGGDDKCEDDDSIEIPIKLKDGRTEKVKVSMSFTVVDLTKLQSRKK